MTDPFDDWEDDFVAMENERVRRMLDDFRALEPPGNAGNSQLEWFVEED